MRYLIKKKQLTTVLVVVIGVISSMILNSTPQQDHEKIVEEVSVNWWQVPVFAVDKAGNPITDLEAGDIEIIINGGIMPRFTLDKRTFLVTEMKETGITDPSVPQASQAIPLKSKAIFLLFDLTMSSDSNIIHSKEIAEKIIMEAEEGTRFFLLTIEPFTGLNYIGEGSDNRDELVWLTRQKVKRKTNRRTVPRGGVNMGGKRGGKYTQEEMEFLREPNSADFKRKTMGFFYSFETLYLCLNSIDANKFIYFFSEGISNDGMTSTRGGPTMYRHYLKEIATYLGRSGAVLFVINAMGVLDSPTAITSGEASLHFLAQQSGGKYLEGANTEIVQTLDNFNHAYYEIAFPDIPVRKDIPRDITITSKRKGVSIHTLSRLEKSKDYSQMNNIEKELTALNVVTKNPLFRTKLSIQNAEITHRQHNEKNVIYTITLPDNYINNTLDLYKFWILSDSNNPAAAQVKKMEKEPLIPKKNNVEIEFKVKAEEEETGQLNTYFVLVHGSANQLYVHGITE